ncbi:MAG TPA: dynein regulation protein LC7, partial [Candidatus Omnitrophica bacterium]|nr:dynein regulation protein LC7 [Candidatus Omnitrophota bacterium]
RLYIDPYTGVVLKKGLYNTKSIKANTINLLNLICLCPDMDNLRLNKKIQEETELFFGLHSDEFLLPFSKYFLRSDYKLYLQAVATTMMLKDWIEEKREDEICEKFSIGPGDIRRLVDLATWLIFSSQELARLFKINSLILELKKLSTRIKYGVKEELLSLVKLKEVGRVRSRALYNSGIKRPADLKKVKIERLMKIANIGKKIATKIKSQVEG